MAKKSAVSQKTPTAEVKPTPEPPKLPTYISKIRLYHPFQNLYIHDIPVVVDLDSWLQAQIDARIVEKC